jgi:hypothetical protein
MRWGEWGLVCLVPQADIGKTCALRRRVHQTGLPADAHAGFAVEVVADCRRRNRGRRSLQYGSVLTIVS